MGVGSPKFNRCYANNTIAVAAQTYSFGGLAKPGEDSFRCTRFGVPFIRMKLPREGKDAMTDDSLRGIGPIRNGVNLMYDQDYSTVHCNFYKWTQSNARAYRECEKFAEEVGKQSYS